MCFNVFVHIQELRFIEFNKGIGRNSDTFVVFRKDLVLITCENRSCKETVLYYHHLRSESFLRDFFT